MGEVIIVGAGLVGVELAGEVLLKCSDSILTFHLDNFDQLKSDVNITFGKQNLKTW